MGLRINTNVLALVAQNNLKKTNVKLATALERLSTGLRVNRGEDDVVALLKSESLRSQIRGIGVAEVNLSNAQSILGVAEGTLAELTEIAQRIRESVVQASDDTISAADRSNLTTAIDDLKAEFDRLVDASEFDGTKLLDGNFTNRTFQVGPNGGDEISFSLSNTLSTSIGKVAQVTSSVVMARINNNGSGAFFASPDGFSINGVSISAADLTSNSDTVSSKENDQSAMAYAAAINSISGQTGVTAEANSNIITITYNGTSTTAVNIESTDQVLINGVALTLQGYDMDDTGMDLFVDAINDVTSSTGVVASLDTSNNKITLTASDGRNIEIRIDVNTAVNRGARDIFRAAESYSVNSAQVANAGGSFLFSSTFTLVSDEQFTVTNAQGTETIFSTNNLTVTIDDNTSLNDLDVSTSTNAQTGLRILDNVIQQLQNRRAEVGSKAIRITTASSELAARKENLTGAESAIRDADIATVTAELTSAQILQQAGVSVLQRTNALPQVALSLLQQ